MRKISWGVLSTAKIGLVKVIPAMKRGAYSRIDAIASRSLNKAKKAAKALGIPAAYGSYQELLDDPGIEAVYVPLPNHLHAEWILKSLAAGKHVLCEKPITVHAGEAAALAENIRKYPHLKVMEAFMYRFHPQWREVKKLVAKGKIGEVKTVHSVFSYYNDDPGNIRNRVEFGGGGLLDIGCYCISLSRFVYGAEPLRVFGTIEFDPRMKIDRLTSAVLEFASGTATFTCSTQLSGRQYVDIIGTKGRVEIEKPFLPLPDGPTSFMLSTGSGSREIRFDACNHYTIQGDLFSRAIIHGTEVPTPIDDSIANMKVIDALFASDRTGNPVAV
ncbi:Gfo/Idh/MocA family oxidoreductase [bacterium]|nr:Gfo/Idh/MocA family oxidoreductase [bacterium]